MEAKYRLIRSISVPTRYRDKFKNAYHRSELTAIEWCEIFDWLTPGDIINGHLKDWFVPVPQPVPIKQWFDEEQMIKFAAAFAWASRNAALPGDKEARTYLGMWVKGQTTDPS